MRRFLATALGVALIVGLFPAVASAALPLIPDLTWGTNGKVNAILRVGNTIYVAGDFTSLQDPVTDTLVPRSYIGGIDATTGAPTSFAPTLNGSVFALTASPDGSKLYVGGNFTTVNGSTQKRIVQFNTATGQKTTWKPAAGATALWPNNVVRAIAVSTDRVYIGGAFTALGSATVTRIAALSPTTGAQVGGFSATADGLVRDLVLASSRLWVGGNFSYVNGTSQNKLTAIDPTSGATISGVYHPSYPVLDMAAGTRLYVAGGGGGGKALAVDLSTGAKIWEMKTDGNVQGVDVLNGTPYFGGHFFKYAGVPVDQMVRANPATGALDQTWLPFVTAGFLGVFAVDAFSNNKLYIGGDFTRVQNEKRLNFAQFTDGAAPTTADLGLTFTGAPSTVNVGQQITYSATITNAGPDSATSATLTDVLPSTLDFVSAPGCTYASATRTVSCALGTVDLSGDSATIVASANTAGSVDNAASVAASTTDPNTANNSATATTTVESAGGADLGVTTSVTTTGWRTVAADSFTRPDSTNLGSTETGGYPWTESGDWTIAGSKLSAAATGNATIDVGSADQFAEVGVPDPSATAFSLVNLRFVNPSNRLSFGQRPDNVFGAYKAVNGVVTTLATIPITDRTLSWRAEVRGDDVSVYHGSDLVFSYTIVDAVLRTGTQVGVRSSSGGSGNSVFDDFTAGTLSSAIYLGSNVDYTLTVENRGPNADGDVVLTDVLPTNLTVNGPATASQGSCTGTTTLTCDLGAMASGDVATVTIPGTAPATPQTMINEASVQGLEIDPVSANDASTTYTSVVDPAQAGDTAAPVMQSMQMKDLDRDGFVDTVDVTFNENLAECAAPCTAGWTLTDVPGLGDLQSVTTSGHTATLTIGGWTAQPDTAVGLFKVALAAGNAIQDAAGNHPSFAAAAPADAAGPVPVGFRKQHPTTGSCTGLPKTTLIEACDELTSEWSEQLAPSSIPATTTFSVTDPVGPGNDVLTAPGFIQGTMDLGSDGYVTADGAAASWSSSTLTLSIARDALTVRVFGTCIGTGCAGQGAVGAVTTTYVPSTSIKDAAGNAAGGSFQKTQTMF
jgi:uncharacterized repeat protein (TIGR01451 family)